VRDGAGGQLAVAGHGGGALIGPPFHGVADRGGDRAQQRVSRGSQPRDSVDQAR
jgi:hypothetical protein